MIKTKKKPVKNCCEEEIQLENTEQKQLIRLRSGEKKTRTDKIGK